MLKRNVPYYVVFTDRLFVSESCKKLSQVDAEYDYKHLDFSNVEFCSLIHKVDVNEVGRAFEEDTLRWFHFVRNWLVSSSGGFS